MQSSSDQGEDVQTRFLFDPLDKNHEKLSRLTLHELKEQGRSAPCLFVTPTAL